MEAKPLPARPSLAQYKKQAKELVKSFRTEQSAPSGDSEAIPRVKRWHLRFAKLGDEQIAVVIERDPSIFAYRILE